MSRPRTFAVRLCLTFGLAVPLGCGPPGDPGAVAHWVGSAPEAARQVLDVEAEAEVEVVAPGGVATAAEEPSPSDQPLPSDPEGEEPAAAPEPAPWAACDDCDAECRLQRRDDALRVDWQFQPDGALWAELVHSLRGATPSGAGPGACIDNRIGTRDVVFSFETIADCRLSVSVDAPFDVGLGLSDTCAGREADACAWGRGPTLDTGPLARGTYYLRVAADRPRSEPFALGLICEPAGAAVEPPGCDDAPELGTLNSGMGLFEGYTSGDLPPDGVGLHRVSLPCPLQNLEVVVDADFDGEVAVTRGCTGGMPGDMLLSVALSPWGVHRHLGPLRRAEYLVQVSRDGELGGSGYWLELFGWAEAAE